MSSQLSFDLSARGRAPATRVQVRMPLASWRALRAQAREDMRQPCGGHAVEWREDGEFASAAAPREVVGALKGFAEAHGVELEFEGDATRE